MQNGHGNWTGLFENGILAIESNGAQVSFDVGVSDSGLPVFPPNSLRGILTMNRSDTRGVEPAPLLRGHHIQPCPPLLSPLRSTLHPSTHIPKLHTPRSFVGVHRHTSIVAAQLHPRPFPYLLFLSYIRPANGMFPLFPKYHRHNCKPIIMAPRRRRLADPVASGGIVA